LSISSNLIISMRILYNTVSRRKFLMINCMAALIDNWVLLKEFAVHYFTCTYHCGCKYEFYNKSSIPLYMYVRIYDRMYVSKYFP